MDIKQIYATVNNIAAVMTKGETKVVDYSSFVSFGNDVLSSETNKETFYNTLVDRIGRTIFAIREYKAANRGILIDSFTFGSILQKVSYKMQEAEYNSTWEKTAQNPYDIEAKGGIIQKLFAQKLPSFAYTDVVYDYQLESAFVDAQHMGGFINGIYTRMYNALEVSIEGMDNAAVGSFVATVAEEVAAGTNTRRVVNLVTDYNNLKGTTLTATTAMSDESFLEYACVEMGTVIPFLGKLTSMYNDGSVERVTPKDKLKIEVNSEFEKSYNVYLKSNTYHDEMVALPGYSDIPYWSNPENPRTIYGKEGTAAVENVIAIFRDEESVLSTLERQKLVNRYDEWNHRTAVKLEADRRYIADTSENAVIFTLN